MMTFLRCVLVMWQVCRVGGDALHICSRCVDDATGALSVGGDPGRGGGLPRVHPTNLSPPRSHACRLLPSVAATLAGGDPGAPCRWQRACGELHVYATPGRLIREGAGAHEEWTLVAWEL